MIILKLLSKFYLAIFIIVFSLYSTNLSSEEEAIDIWNIEKTKNEDLSQNDLMNNQVEEYNTIEIDKIEKNELVEKSELDTNNILLAGIYDPDENGLSINMWLNSNGEEIIKILDRINKKNLSDDAKKILDVALLTNSYFPNQNISEEKFLNYKFDYLIKYKDLQLIKLYLSKNNNVQNNRIVRFYVDEYLSNSDLKNACNTFKNVNIFDDDYLTKFKIYCLLNENKNEEAQLIFDLIKEKNFNDVFFEHKFNFLMGYLSKPDNKVKDKNILDFHLSHRVNDQFEYKPKVDTPKIIWKYLSSSNLLQKVEAIDLENIDEIKIIENATHRKIYNEDELFELYKRFQFNINQLLTARDSYKLLPSYEGRALLYQRILLTDDTRGILDLSFILKNSFLEEKLNNAFYNELSSILSKIDPDEIPSDFSTFYEKNLINQSPKKSSIKLNNKIVHQSKLINYLNNNSDQKKLEKDLLDVLKNIKKNKKYKSSVKDLMLLESIISDGAKIPKKYEKMFKLNQSNIPNDINLLINNKEVGLILLRLVEIIGEDGLNDIGSENVYFIINILNKLNLDKVRNDILLKVLPLKV